MGRHLQSILLGFLAFAGLSNVAGAGTLSSSNGNSTAATFVPPSDGPPAGRVGAGTRETEALDNGLIKLIVPAGGGKTANGSPTLVWAFSQNVDGELRLELSEARSQKPWLTFRETGQWKAGLTGLSLADFGIAMTKGQILHWKMSFLPADGSGPEPAVGSFVEFISTDPPQADAASAMRAFAASGLWFDALAAGIRLSALDTIEMTDPANVEALLASAGAE